MREKAQQQHREVARRLQQESRQRMVEAQEKRVAEGVARRSSRHVSNAFSSLSLALHPSPWVDNLIGFLASSIALALVALILRSLSPQRAKRRSRVAFRHQSDDSEEEGDSDPESSGVEGQAEGIVSSCSRSRRAVRSSSSIRRRPVVVVVVVV